MVVDIAEWHVLYLTRQLHFQPFQATTHKMSALLSCLLLVEKIALNYTHVIRISHHIYYMRSYFMFVISRDHTSDPFYFIHEHIIHVINTLCGKMTDNWLKMRAFSSKRDMKAIHIREKNTCKAMWNEFSTNLGIGAFKVKAFTSFLFFSIWIHSFYETGFFCSGRILNKNLINKSLFFHLWDSENLLLKYKTRCKINWNPIFSRKKTDSKTMEFFTKVNKQMLVNGFLYAISNIQPSVWHALMFELNIFISPEICMLLCVKCYFMQLTKQRL